MRIRTSDAFAFDDRVWIVFLRPYEYLKRHQWNVCSSIRRYRSGRRSRLRARQNDKRLAPRMSDGLQLFAHPVPQTLRYKDLARLRVNIAELTSLPPARDNGEQDRGDDLGRQFDEFSTQWPGGLIGNPQALPPVKLSATTASASSSAQTPIQ